MTTTHSDSVELAALHIIEPARGWPLPNMRELWEYRELAYFLAWREIKVRYKQTVLGVAWAVIQPVMTMIVFSVFFGRLGGMPSDGIPYPIFAYSALLPWQLFAFALTESSNSVVSNQHLITKVYFPRVITPIAAISVGLVDFMVSMAVLAILMVFYGIAPTAAIWTIPLWTLFAVATAFSIGLWLSTLNVRFRDVRYTLPFLTQLWLFASPVAYSVSIVPERWRSLYALNPMVGVIEGFRWALLGKGGAPPLTVFVSALAVSVLLIGGLIYFRRMERTFADVI